MREMRKLPFKEMSVRLAKCLNRVEIFFYEDLKEKTKEDLLEIKNLGRKSLRELKELLYEENPMITVQRNVLLPNWPYECPFFKKSMPIEYPYSDIHRRQSRMKEIDMAICRLKTQEGKTVKEIANIFSVTRGRIYQRLRRIHKLKDRLKKQLDEMEV